MPASKRLHDALDAIADGIKLTDTPRGVLVELPTRAQRAAEVHLQRIDDADVSRDRAALGTLQQLVEAISAQVRRT